MNTEQINHELQVEQDILSAANEVEKKLVEQEVQDVKVVKTPEEELLELVNNPDNRKKALDQAIMLQKMIGSKWIGLSKVLLKTGLRKEGANQLLEMLRLFGYALIEGPDSAKAKQRGEDYVCCIVIDIKEKIAALDSIIDRHYEDIEKLKLEIKILKAQQPEENYLSSQKRIE